MRLFDGKNLVSIEMNNWTGNGYTPDWSNDFFEAGNLPHDEDVEAYRVDDVDYCIEQAMDWKNADGDFYEPDADNADRNVDILFHDEEAQAYIEKHGIPKCTGLPFM